MAMAAVTKAKARMTAAAPVVAAAAVPAAPAAPVARAVPAADLPKRVTQGPPAFRIRRAFLCEPVACWPNDEWKRHEASLPARRLGADGVCFSFRLRLGTGPTPVEIRARPRTDPHIG